MRFAWRQGRASKHLLRTSHDFGWLTRHHRSNDAWWVERLGMLGLLGWPRDAIVLPHRSVSKTRWRENAPRIAKFHQHARRYLSAPRWWRDSLMVESLVVAWHCGHWWWLTHPFPHRYFIPSRFWLGRICRSHRRDATWHAWVCIGSFQRQNESWRDFAWLGQRDSFVCD